MASQIVTQHSESTVCWYICKNECGECAPLVTRRHLVASMSPRVIVVGSARAVRSIRRSAKAPKIGEIMGATSLWGSPFGDDPSPA